MGHRMKYIGGALMAVFWAILIIGCGLSVLPAHNFKCPYTYDIVTGCGKFGMPITSTGTDTETVQTPDSRSACLAVSEYVFIDHPNRVHVICNPDLCEDLGPVMPVMKSMGYPFGDGGLVIEDVDAGFHVLDVDGGPIDAGPPPIVCDGGAPLNCPASNPPQGALTECIGCFTDYCCGVYATQYANAVAADMQDPTHSMTFFDQLLAEALAWMAAGTPAQGSYPAPNPPLLPPASTVGACMVQKCLGVCQQPVPAGP